MNLRPLLVICCILFLAATVSAHTFTSPVDGAFIPDNAWNVTISHDFTENASCNLYLDDMLIQNYAASNTTITFPLTLELGQQELVSTCVFQNTPIPSIASSSFTVDMVDPSPSISPSLQGALNISSAVFPFTIRSDEPIRFWMERNGTTLLDVLVSGNATHNITLWNTTNELHAYATDRAGNSWTAAWNASVVINHANTCHNGIGDLGEQGIDCGGQCSACIPYDILFDQESYVTGEQVDVTVIGRSESTHTITLNGPDLNFTADGAGVAGYFLIPEKAGTYTVSVTYDYLGNEDLLVDYFTVQNHSQNSTNLQVAINADPGTIGPGESIAFNAVVTGGIQPYSYEWDFDNDYLTDSTEKQPNRIFPDIGTYSVRLIVRDLNGQQKEAERFISVKHRHHIELRILENITRKNISQADVQLGNLQKKTNERGVVTFDMYSGDHLLTVGKDGYDDYAETLSVSQNMSKNIILNYAFHDINPPIITVTEPYDGQDYATGPVTIRYRIRDDTDTTCSHYWAQYANVFVELQGMHAVNNGTLYSYSVSPAEAGTSYYKVICEDLFGNQAEASGAFVVGEGAPEGGGTPGKGGITELSAEEKQTELDNGITFDLNAALERLDVILSDYTRADESTKRLIDSLGLIKDIESKKKELRLTHRDLFNLQYRRLNDKELAAEQNRLLQKLETLQDSTIESVKVKDEKSYVRYATPEQTKAMTQEFASTQSTPMDEDQLAALLEGNNELSSKLTVSTYLFLAELTYLNGERKLITLVSKDFTLGGNLTDKMIVEIIPKTFAEDVKDITFLSDIDVLKEDPIVEIKDHTQLFSYYREEFLDLDSLGTATTLLTYQKVPKRFNQGLFSGFAIFSKDSGSGSGKGIHLDLKTSLLASIILSLAVFLLFNTGSMSMKLIRQPKKLLQKIPGKKAVKGLLLSKRGREIKKDCKILQEYIIERRLEKAHDLMEETKGRLKKLKKAEQDVLAPKIAGIDHDLAIASIREGLDSARKHLKDGLVDVAKATFVHMREEFAKLSKDSKQIFHKDLAKLAEDIDHAYLTSMVKKAHAYLDEDEHTEAMKIYQNIKVLFKQGSQRIKEQTHAIAMDLVHRFQKELQRRS